MTSHVDFVLRKPWNCLEEVFETRREKKHLVEEYNNLLLFLLFMNFLVIEMASLSGSPKSYLLDS